MQVEADNYRYNEDMLDDPVLPSMRGESMDLKACLSQRELYLMLGKVTLELGYEPNASGTYSYRKYAISMVCRALGYHKATRVAQHNRASAPAVNAVYDNDNANEDIGAAEMGRRQETMEAVESLAATRVPAIGQFVSPSQVPRDSRAYKEELLESSEWGAANANLGKAEAACKLARVGGPKQQLKKAEAALKDAKAARTKLRQKLMHRVLVRHRLYVWKEGFERLLRQASREELQRLCDVCEYPTMSEAQAVVFHLEAYAARERAAAAKAAAAVSRKRTAHDAAACAGVVHAADGDGGRAARRMAWRASRAEQQGYELEADEVQATSPSALASDAAVAPAELPAAMLVVSDVAVAPAVAAAPAVSHSVVLPLELQAAPMVALDEETAPAEVSMVDAGATLAVTAAPLVPVVASAAVPASKEQRDEALLCEYERLMSDPSVANAKQVLSATYKGCERQMMRRLAAARARRGRARSE